MENTVDIRKRITEKIKSDGTNRNIVAKTADINVSNFYQFLSRKRGIEIDQLEKVFDVLNL